MEVTLRSSLSLPAGTLFGSVDVSSFLSGQRVFSDVTVVARDGSAKAHRLVLAAGCPLLCRALLEAKDDDDDVRLLLPDFTLSQVEPLLKMLYGLEREEEPDSELLETCCCNWRPRALTSGAQLREEEINTDEPLLGCHPSSAIVLAEEIAMSRHTIRRNYPLDDEGHLMCPVLGCEYKSADGDRRRMQNHVSVVHRKIECRLCFKKMSRKNLTGHIVRIHSSRYGEVSNFDESMHEIGKRDNDDASNINPSTWNSESDATRRGQGQIKSSRGDEDSPGRKFADCRPDISIVDVDGQSCGSSPVTSVNDLVNDRIHGSSRPRKGAKRRKKLETKPKKKSMSSEHFEPNPTDPEQCSKCLYKSQKLHKLKKHYREYHERPQCPFCQKKYSFYFLDRHIRTAHTHDLQYQCQMCPMQFYRERQLQHHLEEQHVKELKYVCEVCGDFFYSQNTLSRHKTKRHNACRYFPCDLCNKAYLSNGSLKKHQRRHHNSFQSAEEQRQHLLRDNLEEIDVATQRAELQTALVDYL